MPSARRAPRAHARQRAERACPSRPGPRSSRRTSTPSRTRKAAAPRPRPRAAAAQPAPVPAARRSCRWRAVGHPQPRAHRPSDAARRRSFYGSCLVVRASACHDTGSAAAPPPPAARRASKHRAQLANRRRSGRRMRHGAGASAVGAWLSAPAHFTDTGRAAASTSWRRLFPHRAHGLAAAPAAGCCAAQALLRFVPGCHRGSAPRETGSAAAPPASAA